MTAGLGSARMWEEAWEMLARAERLQRRFFEVSLVPTARPTWEPPVDLFETAECLWLLVALPGADPSRIEIHLDSDAITICAERPLPTELRAAAIHRLEIPHGHFERRVDLPEGSFVVERQSFRHGCLVLGLRRRG